MFTRYQYTGQRAKLRSIHAFIAVLTCLLALLAGCKDTRSATRPPPPSDIATGATHATLQDPKGALAISTAPAKPPRVSDPFDAPPSSSSSADPLAPLRTRPTEL